MDEILDNIEYASDKKNAKVCSISNTFFNMDSR